MGLFSPKKVVGTIRLDFRSHTEVAITDAIPDATSEVPYPLWFAFMYAGKLLYNFPGESGLYVVRRGNSALGSVVNEDNPLAYNGSMLGVLCEQPITIVPGPIEGRWVYTGKLFYKGDNLLVDTRIARSDEAHFHCAAIDTVFECMRRRLGDKGGAVCASALGYFNLLSSYGCRNLLRNLQYAASAAMLAATWAGLI